MAITLIKHKPYSIQKRLSQRVVIFTGLVFLVVALISDLIITQWLEHEFDETLEEKASLLVTLTKDTPEGLDFDFADEFMPEFEDTENPEYFQLWLDDGSVFERSHSLIFNNLEHLKMQQPGQQIKDVTL